MPQFYSIFLLVHILAMAVWFAGGLTIAGDVRKALALGAPHLAPMVARVNAAERLGTLSGMITAISGFALIFSGGGFSAMPIRIHLGLALTIITFFVNALFTNTTWRKIAGIIERNDDLSGATLHAKRLAMFAGIEHLLRTVIIVLMVVPL